MDGWMDSQGHSQPPDSAGGWTPAWHGLYFSAPLPAAPSSLHRHKHPPLPPTSTGLSAAHSTKLQEGLLVGLGVSGHLESKFCTYMAWIPEY